MSRVVLLLLLGMTILAAREAPWVDLPATHWDGRTAVLPSLHRAVAAATVDTPLTVSSAQDHPPGLYAVRLTLRSSHAADAVAWRSTIAVHSGTTLAASWPGHRFAHALQPETVVAELVHAGGPLRCTISVIDPATKAVKRAADPFDEAELDPAHGIFAVVDQVEIQARSRTARVVSVHLDRIRYAPGATLRGTVALADVGGGGGGGDLIIFLERGLQERQEVARQPVTLSGHQDIPFTVTLPDRELGYAVIAQWVSGDDRSEAAEYFTIAADFQRVALFGASAGGTRDVVLTDDQIRAALAKGRAEYYNTVEYPFWAPDDLLELTPDGERWFSGQSNYHMHRRTMQRQIALAREQGVAMVTYGKWTVSGPIGWDVVYERPQDFTATYSQPIGSWDAHDAWIFDLRRNGEQVPYTPRPILAAKGPAFDPWWNSFVGISPDPSLAMIRTAAEELADSIDQFGWDAIRWDGHIRVGWNATGRSGKYEAWAARQTQTLVRYFKDVVAQRHPTFAHGYNYFLIEKNKTHAWAREDFELDELSRGGGLLMNESIGNASAGWTFAEIANNLQVEGDLARERGAYYLGISFANGPCDVAIESALWAAAGCRPYNSGMDRETRRYLTRFAAFTLDERLRRLAEPEAVLQPRAPTRLWWQGFVYETPEEAGRRHLVVNLLNLPLDGKRPARGSKGPEYRPMPPGTDPVTFAITVPAGLRATGAHLIDPCTLTVVPLALDAGLVTVPAVATWSVLIIDLVAEPGAPVLADAYGVPRTLGVAREDLDDQQRLAAVAIDPSREVWEVNKSITPLQPDWAMRREAERAAIAALPPAERVAALRAKRAENTPEKLADTWWKGGVILDDHKRKDQPRDHIQLRLQRNGVLDVFHGRGAMDHRLRLGEAFARLDRVRIHDAPFYGSFRGAGLAGLGLRGNIPWSRLGEFDVLLYTGIPYAAIGIDTCYALPAYVRAGGGIWFTGGEWAFGKGGYLHTVLERELLPVECVEMTDTRILAVDAPGIMQPGPDFAELGMGADFTAAQPAFWVYNQVLLKDQRGIKVFLTSEHGPILVGWQLGAGRVACLLVDHRGRSTERHTAFFDLPQWPTLAAAVLQWLAAGTAAAADPIISDGASVAQLQARWRAASEEAALGPARAPVKLGKDQRAAAEADVMHVLSAPPTAVDAAVLLDHVHGLVPLSDALVFRLAAWLRAQPPRDLAARRATWLASKDDSLRFLAWQLLDDPHALRGERALEPTPPAAQRHAHAVAMAVAALDDPALVPEARSLLAHWNAEEAAVRDAWTNGQGFSVVAPDHPCLDAVSVYRRIAILAYLTRHDPARHGAQFVREWLMTHVYQDFCDRSAGNKRPGDWAGLRIALGALRTQSQPLIENLGNTHPAVVGEGLASIRYTREYLAARNLLGAIPAGEATAILRLVIAARHADLAAFARARLETNAP